jgi:NAD(P)-dependent dehydrogenase (short-subunit alcohol dehydrogenase family)
MANSSSGKGMSPLLLAALGAGAYFAARGLLRATRSIDLDGRIAFITGGSRGLGLVLARQLADEGMRLALCARDDAELERARLELAGRTQVLTLPCDVRERAQVERAVADTLAYFGQLDVLINNAGIITVAPMEEMRLEDFEDAMRTHYWGPLYAILAALPHMRQRRQGRIVNVSSIGGAVSVPHLLPYSGSKFALRGLSEGLRAELSKDNILVTTVLPGLMRTGSPRNASFKGQNEAEYVWFSVSDSLPLLSMSAESAARQIIAAFRAGEAEAVLSLPAQVATTIHGLFPGLTADVLGLVNRLLPGPGGIGDRKALGKDSESEWAPSLLTRLSDEAAARNNELKSGELAVTDRR